MRKFTFLSVIILTLFISVLPACGNKTVIPTGSMPPPTIEASDDIVFTPGGYAYRTNVHEQGVVNPWLSVHIDNVALDGLSIYYRAAIETKAGETRSNIIEIYDEDGIFDTELTLYSLDVPDGIMLIDAGNGSRPGMLQKVLAIEISTAVSPDQYSFKIGIKLNDKDYGTILCTINVVT